MNRVHTRIVTSVRKVAVILPRRPVRPAQAWARQNWLSTGIDNCRASSTSAGEQSRPCKLVIFDKDGTLLDDSATWAPVAERAANELSSLCPDGAAGISKLLGYNASTKHFHSNSIFMTGTNKEVHRYLADNCNTALADAFVELLGSLDVAGLDHHPIMPLTDLLTPLQSVGMRTAVLTSDDRRFTEVFLRNGSALDLIDAVVCGDDQYQPKPSAEPALSICSSLDVAPEEAVIVGDSWRDMQCGVNAGLGSCIGVATGTASSDMLYSAGAHVVVPSVAHVLEAIRGRHAVVRSE